MDNKKTKTLIISILSVILIILVWVWVNYFINSSNGANNKTWVLWLEKTKNKEFVGKNISAEEVDNKKVFEKTQTWLTDLEKKKEKIKEDLTKKELDKLKPYVRTVCQSYKKIYDFLNSQSTMLIKKKVDDIAKKSSDKDYFLYVSLPEVVFSECIKVNTDTTFIDGIVRYLQSDYSAAMALDKADVEKFVKYIDDINMWSDSEISKEKIKTDKEYFKKVFFEDKLSEVEKIYFSEYTFYKDKTDEEYFKHFSILSLEERNEIFERTLWKLKDFLEKVWIKNIEEFRTLILTNYGYWKNVNELKAYLISKYKLLDSKLKEKWVNLTSEMIDNNSLYTFYTGKNFETLKNDPEIYKIFKELWIGYVHYSIISSKFAETLNEGWSWQEQFWDSVIWNGIIKIGFLNLRESTKTKN